MSLGVQAAAALASAPDWFIPCPVGTFLGVDTLPDLVRFPGATIGRRGGKLMFLSCSSSCPVCAAFVGGRPTGIPAGVATIPELAGAWNEYLLALARKAPGERLHTTLVRMGHRGMLPPGFAERLEGVLP